VGRVYRALGVLLSTYVLVSGGIAEAGRDPARSEARARRARFRDYKAKVLSGPVGALLFQLERHHKGTWKHSVRVASLAYRIAKDMGLREKDQHRVWLAGVAHDLGKLDVPLSILENDDPDLTDDELAIILRHPSLGADRLRRAHASGAAVNGALTHHERLDGHGYPQKLSGKRIPRSGRIVAVADAYEAISAHRAYQSELGKQDAIRILQDGVGLQWDPVVVESLLRVMRVR
jgi:putative nucleotidyltransferase with HDIG domain